MDRAPFGSGAGRATRAVTPDVVPEEPPAPDAPDHGSSRVARAARRAALRLYHDLELVDLAVDNRVTAQLRLLARQRDQEVDRLRVEGEADVGLRRVGAAGDVRVEDADQL